MVVNELPLEEYVTGSVQAEAGDDHAAGDAQGPGHRGTGPTLPTTGGSTPSKPYEIVATDRCTSSTRAR